MTAMGSVQPDEMFGLRIERAVGPTWILPVLILLKQQAGTLRYDIHSRLLFDLMTKFMNWREFISASSDATRRHHVETQ